MSYRSPSSQQLASFSPSSKSFKRRSLQSPFILNDLSGDAEQLETGKKEEADFSDYEDNNSNDNIINETFNSDSQSVQSQTDNTTRVSNTNYYHHSGFVQPAFPDLDKMYTSSINSNDNLTVNSLPQFSESSSPKLNNKNNRFSLQMPSANISSSSSSSHKYHKRSTSTASVNYTPAPLNIPPIKLNVNTPPMTSIETLNGNHISTNNSNNNSPIVQPFQFNSMMMSNNSSENLSLQSTNNNGITKQPQILPKASYRRGHRYKHSSVSMNMFQDPQRIASMNKPHNLPKKYEIPRFKQILSLISSSQKKKLFVCFIQISVTLTSYVLGYNYNNSCLLTLSHILFYDVISNLSLVMVQIMSNFEVWRLSSLKFPFGLGRIEVLFGFALSVSLLFVGLDLFSHILEEFLIVSLVNDGNFENNNGSLHNHGKNNDNVNVAKNLNPILYEIFIILIILVTVSTSHIVNSKNNIKEDEIIDKINTNIINNNNISNAKRLNSITLKEPIRENLITELSKYIKFKLGIKSNLFHGSTTGLSLFYSIYSLYYPFAQGLFKLHGIHDESLQLEGHDHVEDANKMTEWINHGSTIIIAILISVIAWKLIWRLGNILLLSSPSINMKFEHIEEMIESNIRELDVYKSSYNITEIKVARLNTKMYVVIVCVNMPGASDDDEAKFRFYTMRIVHGVMLQTVNGQLSTRERNSAEDKRRSLIDLLNLSTSIEDAEGTESENFEITVDINRL
jgi:Co/Zn/Cd efflux system component